MSSMLQLPIEIFNPGTPPGLSQFGSLQPSGNDSSAPHLPFSQLLASMSPAISEGSASPSESHSVNPGGKERSSSASSEFSVLSSLIALFLKLSKESGIGGSNVADSGGDTAAGKSTADLLAKVRKEVSSLLSAGLASTSTNSSTASSGSAVSGEAGSEANQGISEFVQRLLNDPGIQSDLEKLAKASESSSLQTGYAGVIEDLMSRIRQLKSDSSANDPVKPGGQNVQTGEMKSVDTTDPAGNKSVGDGASPSFTVGDLRELVSRVAGNSSGSNSPGVTMSVSAEVEKAGQNSGKSINELLQNLGHAAGMQSFRKGAGEVSHQNLSSAASASAKTVVQKGEARVSSGSGLKEAINVNLQDAAETTSTASQKATSANVSLSSGKQGATAVNSAVKSEALQAAGASGTFSRQDSTKSDGSQAGTMSGTLADAFRNTTTGTGAASTFKQALSAASQNSSSATDVKATPYQVSQTILRGVNMMNEGGKTVVTLKLQPESLGTVSLQVASDSGKISAQFNVGTPDARAALEASIPQMRQMLQTNGISLSHLSVNLTGGQSHSSHPQYQPRRQSTRFYTVTNSETQEALRSFGYNTMEVKV